MPNDNRQKLFRALNDAGYDIGKYDEFDRRMNNADDRLKFYNAVQNAGYDIGDYDEYERRIKDSKYKLNINNKLVPVSEKEYKDFAARHPGQRTSNGSGSVSRADKGQSSAVSPDDPIVRNLQGRVAAKPSLAGDAVKPMEVPNLVEEVRRKVNEPYQMGQDVPKVLTPESVRVQRMGTEERVNSALKRVDTEDVAAKTYDDADRRATQKFLDETRGSFAPVEWQGTQALAAHLSEHDLRRMADEAWNRLGQSKQTMLINDIYEAYKKEYPSATEEQLQTEARNTAKSLVDRRMYDEAVKRNAPKDAAELFLRKLQNTSMGSLRTAAARSMAGTTGDLLARDAAEAEFEKNHKAAGIAGSVMSVAADPVTWMSGGVGTAAGKGAVMGAGKVLGEQAARKFSTELGGRLAQGIIGGGVNFATFESATEALSQLKYGGTVRQDLNGGVLGSGMSIGDYSAAEIGKKALHGAATGAAVGVVAPFLGNASDKLVRATNSTAGKVGIRAGELGVGTLAEGTIFAVPELVNTYRDFENEIASLSDKTSKNYIADEKERERKIANLKEKRGDSLMDVWGDNMAMIAGFKLHGLVKSAPDRIREISSSGKGKAGFETRLRNALDGKEGLSLTEDEKQELQKGGYADLKELTEEYQRATEESQKEKKNPENINPARMIGKGTSEELPYNRFVELMNDQNISEAARAKMYYYVTGNALPMSTVMGYTMTENYGADGKPESYTVTSNGKNGVITSRTFTSQDRANTEVQRILRQAELNTIDLGEQFRDYVADVRRTDEAIDVMAEDFGIGKDALRELLRKSPETLTEQERQTLEILENYKRETQGKYDAASMRAEVGENYGVDVDKAIKKEPLRRTENEKIAVEEYAKKLYEGVEIGEQERESGPVDETVAADPIKQIKGSDGLYEEGTDSEPVETDRPTTEQSNNTSPSETQPSADPLSDMVKDRTHKQTGNVIPVRLFGTQGNFFLKDGNVVTLPNGRIDTHKSSSEIIVIDNDGNTKMLSPDAIEEIGIEILPSDYLEQERLGQDALQNADTVTPAETADYTVGDGVTLPDGRNGEIFQKRDDGTYDIAVMDDRGNYAAINLTKEELDNAEIRPGQYTTTEETDTQTPVESPTSMPQDDSQTEQAHAPQPEETPQTPASQPAETPADTPTERYRQLSDRYGEKTGHKIDVTLRDRTGELDKTQKALQKAQQEFDDAPIGKEEKAEKALEKARKAYEEAKAEVDSWKAVKEEHDKIVQAEAKVRAEQDALRNEQAVEEERQRQAEEIAKREEQAERGAHAVHPAIREKWDAAPKIEGAENEITLANGERIKGRYVLVESGAATPSHNPSMEFVPYEGFPVDENGQTVNDRDYERDKEAQDITRQTGANYDSRALQSVPVVSNDGVVLSGNGRTMAGELAARDNTDGAYIDHLRKYPQQFGFTSEQVDGMQHPRVLFVPDEPMPYTTETFAKFNQQDMKSQSRTEQSVKLGKTVDDATFNRVIRSINSFDTIGDFYNDTKASTEAISELRNAGAINSMQYAEMFDGEKISGIGRQMLENMLIGKAFESNPDAIRQLAEYPSMRQSVISALAEISTNVGLGEEYSLESELAEAISLAYQARKNGYKAGDLVSDYARQLNLFPFDMEETVADYTNATVLMLADVLNDNRTSMLKKALTMYNHAASESASGQMDIFSGSVKDKKEIIKDVLNTLNYGTQQEQQAALTAAAERRKAEATEQSTSDESLQQDGTTPAVDSGSEDTGRSERSEEEIARLTHDEAITLIAQMEKRADVAPDVELTIENWDAQFGEDGRVNTPIGDVKIGENQFTKLMRQGRDGKLGMIKPTLETPDVIIEDASKAKEDGVTERNSSYVFVKAFKKADGSRYYYFTSITVKKDRREVVVSSQEKSRNRLLRLMTEGKMLWRTPKDATTASVEQQGLDYAQPSETETATKGSGITPQSIDMSPSADKGSEQSATMQGKGERLAENQTPNAVQSALAVAEQETNTEPTEAQKEAGNYKKGHVKIDGYDVTIENPKGSVRSGTDASGKQWEQEMQNTYGYIRGTEGVDGDHIDVFFSDDPSQGDVFVVDQVNKDGSFDEHKVMYGFPDIESARKAYLSNYEDGWQGLGAITPVSKEEFKKWIDSSHRKTKPFAEYSSVKPLGDTQKNTPRKTDSAQHSFTPSGRNKELAGKLRELEDRELALQRDRENLNGQIESLEAEKKGTRGNKRKEIESKIDDLNQQSDELGKQIDALSEDRQDAFYEWNDLNSKELTEHFGKLSTRQLELLAKEKEDAARDDEELYDDAEYGTITNLLSERTDRQGNLIERDGTLGVDKIETSAKNTAAHFPMETQEEAMAFDKRVPEMDDAELLAYMQADGKGNINKAQHPSVYDEYDYRHGDEIADTYEDTLTRLQESSTTPEQAEEMLANIHGNMERFATEERPLLLGQEEALQEYIDRLKNMVPDHYLSEHIDRLAALQENKKTYDENAYEAYAAGRMFGNGVNISLSKKEAYDLADKMIDENKSRGGVYILPFLDGIGDSMDLRLGRNKDDVAKREKEYREKKKGDEETGNVMSSEPTTTYETRDGKKVVWRSLFDDMGVRSSDEVAKVSQHTGQEKPSDAAIAPSEIRLRKLKKGETCHVERVYEETKQFDFTGKEKVESAEDVAYIFRQLENAAVENSFLVLLKDGKPTVIHLGVGSYVGVMAPYEQALVAYSKLKPEQVYFVHNHPSGTLKASRQDQDLLNRIKRAFGENVVQQGIIIDTTSGNYGEFESIETAYETYSVEEEMPQSQGGEVPVKVYQFSRQVFAPDWNPETAFQIASSQSVAEFVSSHRLGEHKKMSFLVVNNQNKVVANIFLPWTKLSDIKRRKDAGDLLAGYVHQCGGVRGVLYGNYDYEPDDQKVLASVGSRMRQLNAPLLDALHVEHSAFESGWVGVGEPTESFGGNSGYVGNSKSKRAATKKTLMGVHNISEEKLRKAIRQGGLANPSLAVIDTENGVHSDFGDISLIPKSTLIDSETGRNAGTYTGDAWTSTYPHVTRRLTKQGDEHIERMAKEAAGGDTELERHLTHNLRNYIEGANDITRMLYLIQKGIEPEIVPQRTTHSQDEFDAIQKIFGEGTTNMPTDMTKEQNDALLDLMVSTYEKKLREKENPGGKFYERIKELNDQRIKEYRDNLTDENEKIWFAKGDTFVYENWRDEKRRKEGTPDWYWTDNAARDKVTKEGLTEDFEKWKEGLFDEGDIEEVLFAGFDRDGNRKYVPNTVANASRLMNKEADTNAYNNGGLNATRSGLLKKMLTLSAIRKNKNLLQGKDKYEEKQKEMSDKLFGIIEQVSDMQQISDNKFSNIDYAEARLQEAITRRDPVAYMNKEYGYHIDKDGELAKEIADFKKEASNLPVKYFETKFRRPVGLNEFSVAVVPENTSEDVMKALQDAGLDVRTYDGTEEDRKAVTLEAVSDRNDVLFREESTKDSNDKLLGDYSETETPSSAETIGSTATETGEKLGVKVRLIHSREELPKEWTEKQKRNRRGWYDTRTGEIAIVVPNNADAGEVVRTLLHEAVGHKGLRELFGEDFDIAMDNIYHNVTEEIREQIDDKARQKGWNTNTATEEYLSSLAEDANYEAAKKNGTWAKIKNAIIEMLRRVGLRLGVKLTDADLRYILWRSHENMTENGRRGVFGEAKDAAMREKLGVNNASEALNERFSEREEEGSGRSLFEQQLLALDKLAESHKENLNIRRMAIEAMNGQMSRISHAMSIQKEYDKSTVDGIVRLARTLMEMNGTSQMTRGEVKKLLSQVRSANGRKDVTKQAGAVFDLLQKHQEVTMRNLLNKLLSVKGAKTNSSGVKVQGRMDARGEEIVRTMKESMMLDNQSLNERINDARERMESDDDHISNHAAWELTGLLLAEDYADNIRKSEAEDAALMMDLEKAKQEKKKGLIGNDAFSELEKEITDNIRYNRGVRLERYKELMTKLGLGIQESVLNAEQFRESERERANEIRHFANSDLQGIPAYEHGGNAENLSVLGKISNLGAVRSFLRPLVTFDEILRKFGEKSPYGTGYLWNRFMRGYVETNDSFTHNLRAAHKELDDKVSKVMGRKMRWSDLFSIERKMPMLDVEWTDGGTKRTFKLSQGNLLYIYMVNKMSDGRMKLRKMGITDEIVEQIKEKIDPRFVELGDWLQNDFLQRKGLEYAKVYEREFGTSMPRVENYFPLKINKNSRGQDIDVSKEEESPLASTITGSVIQRVRNTTALDLTGSNAFDIVLSHLEEMEHWAAYIPFIKDLNTLLSYKKFRNRVHNMNSLRFGSGTELWKNFCNSAMMVAGTYRPEISKKHETIDETISNIAKGVTQAKISFRVYTALKQLLSSPAYLSETSIGNFLKNNPITGGVQAWNWAIKNLPGFEERWLSRQAGDSRLKKTDISWQFWSNKMVEKLSQWGMSPNAFVDAVTVACGAKAMYESYKSKYLKDGYEEAEAERRALQDAAISYNETQQSSEAAYLSTMQVDRTVLSNALTVFRNASMAYQRRFMRSLKTVKDYMKPGYKEEAIGFVSKQLERDGLDHDNAMNVARERVQHGWKQALADVAIFGFILQFAWDLGPNLIYLIFGDDDDKKKEILTDAASHALLGGVEGFSGGSMISDLGHNLMNEGSNFYGYNMNLLPLMSDMQNIIGKLGSDNGAALYQTANLLTQSLLGLNPETITNWAVAIDDACNGDLETQTEVVILIARLMNAPESQIKELYIDQIAATGEEARQMPVEELARRYAAYKAKREMPLMFPLESKEMQEARIEKKAKTFRKAARERLKMHAPEWKKKLEDYKNGEYKQANKAYKDYQSGTSDVEPDWRLMERREIYKDYMNDIKILRNGGDDEEADELSKELVRELESIH